MNTEARNITSHIILTGVQEVDVLAVACWLEGCMFPEEAFYLPMHALEPPVVHELWQQHENWVEVDEMALPFENDDSILCMPRSFLERPHPGSLALLNDVRK